MQVRISFYSWFKDLTGCSEVQLAVTTGTTLGQLRNELAKQFPKLAAAQKSVLIAVGLDYQDASYVLREGDEVSFFPPVQGG